MRVSVAVLPHADEEGSADLKGRLMPVGRGSGRYGQTKIELNCRAVLSEC